MDFHWISWTKGEPFQWGDFRYNSGNPYKNYRIGPLLIRVFIRKLKMRIIGTLKRPSKEYFEVSKYWLKLPIRFYKFFKINLIL